MFLSCLGAKIQTKRHTTKYNIKYRSNITNMLIKIEIPSVTCYRSHIGRLNLWIIKICVWCWVFQEKAVSLSSANHSLQSDEEYRSWHVTNPLPIIKITYHNQLIDNDLHSERIVVSKLHLYYVHFYSSFKLLFSFIFTYSAPIPAKVYRKSIMVVISVSFVIPIFCKSSL